MKGNHIPTPSFLMPLKEGFFDPYPLNGEGPIEPPKDTYVVTLRLQSLADLTQFDGSQIINLIGDRCLSNEAICFIGIRRENVWVNPGFSRKREAWKNAKRWAKEGHYVLCYLPIEGSTNLGFDVAKTEQNGDANRLTPHKRPYEGCRDIEIIILEAKPAIEHKGENRE